MEFWSRLLGGNSTTSRQSTSASPQQRLSRFKRTYDQIRTTYQRSPLLSANSTAAETIRTSFQRLTTAIQDETRAPAPHLCLQFAASAQIYTTVSRIGAVAQHEGIIREAVSFFAALIDSEEEDFLGSPRFAHALMVFVDRTAGSGNLFVGEDTECEIVELMFGIAAKIRLQPEILTVWFRERKEAAPKQEGNGTKAVQDHFVGVTSKEDFPLCYQLIDHVHHEGRIGDFARTGLLYIFESASKSAELEAWIVASDMPTLMATGLGALYSQLSRKLSIVHPTEDMPVILTLSDYKELKAPEEAEGMYTDYLQAHLSTFLSYLAFWQDVFEHCRSVDVKQTLLDHLQVLFLQQLLYPSMLESSDVDGGSSVAVLTYLRQILVALDHAELVNLLLRYLLAFPEPTKSQSPTTLKKTASLILLTQPANEEDRMNPSLFSMIDLLQSSVTSENPQTVISALKLVTVLLGKNHAYAIDSLLQTQPPAYSGIARTHGALNAEIELYMEMAENIAGSAGLDEAYQSHLGDAQRLLESHSCANKFLDLSAITGSTAFKDLPRPVGPREVTSHNVRIDDPFLNKLLVRLKSFLTNNVEVNLALTEVFVTLLTCPQSRLDGWLAVDPAHYIFNDAQVVDEAPIDAARKLKNARKRPTWQNDHTPILMVALQGLQDELEGLRSQIKDLDNLIAARKQAFRLHSDILGAVAVPKSPEPPTGSREASQSRKISDTLLQQRLRDAVSTPSRPQSRGRPQSSSPKKVSLLSQYAPGVGSPTRAEGTPIPSVGTPTRPGITPSTSSQRLSDATARQSGSGSSSRVASQKTLLDEVMASAKGERLKQRIKFPVIDADCAADGNADGNADGHAAREASLSHVLTNAVVLQEFILEIIAILQIRASLFGEVLLA